MSPPGKSKLTEKKRSVGKRLLRRRNARHFRVAKGVRHNRLPSETPPPKAHVDPVPSSNKVWENIVIHYLNKLKSAWRPNPKPLVNTKPIRLNVESTTNIHKATTLAKGPRVGFSPEPCTSVAQTSVLRATKSQTSIGTAVSVDNSKKTAMNIVTNALEYGQAKGLISKNGKFFWLRNEKSLPKIAQKLCKNCNLYHHRKAAKRSLKKSMSLTTTTSEDPKHYSKLKGRTKHPGAFKKYRKKLRKYRVSFDTDCSCNECKARRH